MKIGMISLILKNEGYSVMIEIVKDRRVENLFDDVCAFKKVIDN